jgi:hypothetical protein
MTEYSVLFATKISAKSKSDLERKAEKVGLELSKCLKKGVYPHSYGEIVKKDRIERPEEKLC